jgi:hypothetical protein
MATPLACQCGSRYFEQFSMARYNNTTIGPGMGYRAVSDAFKAYRCVNNHCQRIHLPEFGSMQVSRDDLAEYSEITQTVEGKPVVVEPPHRPYPNAGEVRAV